MPLVSQFELVTAAIAGEIVSFPTDTVPALAVRPDQSLKIYDLKQRSFDKPLILMAASVIDLEIYWQGNVTERAIWQTIMAKHWPGELTLILPASDQIPIAINPLRNGTIALRIPKAVQALDILSQTGPLATTSANLSSQPPLTNMGAITLNFPTVFSLNCLDNENNQSLETLGTLGNGQPSTIAQWQSDRWQILRQGNVVIK